MSVGLLQFVGGNNSFNGGRSQIQTDFIEQGGDFALLNLFKMSQNWGYSDNSGPLNPANMDSNNYPTSLPGGVGVNTVFFIPTQGERPGNYVYKWDGDGVASQVSGTAISYAITAASSSGSSTIITLTGTLNLKVNQLLAITGVTGGTWTGLNGTYQISNISGQNVTVSCNSSGFIGSPGFASAVATNTLTTTYKNTAGATVLAGAGRYVSSMTLTFSGRVAAGIASTNVSNPINNCRFCHADDESLLDAGKIFNTNFIAKLKASGAAVLRFLNWQNGNNSNETTWSTRKPVTAFSYGADYFPPSIVAGITTSVGNDYSISFGSGNFSDKQTIILNFDDTSVSVDSITDTITWTSHGLTTGNTVYFVTAFSGGSAPGGITLGTAYYVIVTGANTFQIATTLANAVGNVPIDITSNGANVFAHQTMIQQPVTINTGTGVITFTNGVHLLSTAEPVGFMNTGTIPAGVTCGANYYAIIVSPTTIKLATSIANANSGTAISFSTAGSSVNLVRQPTLSLNGNTAVPIKDNGGYTVNTGATSTPKSRSGTPSSINYASLVYDADLNTLLITGGTGASPHSRGIACQVPPEICLQAAIQAGMHPWFVSPFMAVDPMTDYWPELMNLCNTTGPSWMIPRFEVYNESFNSLSAGVTYGTSKGFAHWGVVQGYPYDWVGKVGSTLGQTATAIYGGLPNGAKYHVIVGTWTSTFTSGSTAVTDAPLMTSAQYNAQAAAAQTLVWRGGTINYTKDPCYFWATHLCCDQYMTPTNATGSAFTTAVTNWSAYNTANFDGGITGTTLTTTGSVTLITGDTLVGPYVAQGTTIVTGGTGTSFPVSISQNIPTSSGTAMYTVTDTVSQLAVVTAMNATQYGPASATFANISGRAVCWSYIYAFGQTYTNQAGNKIGVVGYEGSMTTYTRGVTGNSLLFENAAKLDANLSAITTNILPILGTANNGSGLVRLTLPATSPLTTGSTITVLGQVAGSANWVVTVIDGTHIDLQGSVFASWAGGYQNWNRRL